MAAQDSLRVREARTPMRRKDDSRNPAHRIEERHAPAGEVRNAQLTILSRFTLYSGATQTICAVVFALLEYRHLPILVLLGWLGLTMQYLESPMPLHRALGDMVWQTGTDFLLVAMDQIVNYVAKWQDMFDRQVDVPLVIRSVVGRGWGCGRSARLAPATEKVRGKRAFADFCASLRAPQAGGP